MNWLTILYIVGALASIAGFAMTIWIARKDDVIEQEVHELKTEEEDWHDEQKDSSKITPSDHRDSSRSTLVCPSCGALCPSVGSGTAS